MIASRPATCPGSARLQLPVKLLEAEAGYMS